MKIKLRKLFALQPKLNQINLKGVKVNYALVVVKKQVEEHVEAARASLVYPEEYMHFLAKRTEIINKYKADSGVKLVLGDTELTIKEEDIPKLTEELQKLTEEYKETLDEVGKINEEFNTLLDSEVEIKPKKVKLSDLPNDIDTQTLEVFYELGMIKE